MDKFLDYIYEDIVAFTKGAKLQLHMNSLTRGLLGFEKATNYPSACLAKFSNMFICIMMCNQTGSCKE